MFLGISCALGPGPIQNDSDTLDNHMRLGVGFLETGNYPRALREFLEAEKLERNNAAILNHVAIAYFFREDYGLSENYLLRALAIDPNFTDARNNLGRLYVELGRFKPAIYELQRVIADLTYSSPEKAHFNMGLAYFNAEDYEQASRYFSKSISLKQGYCEGQVQLGITNYYLEKFGQAVEGLQVSLPNCKSQADQVRYFIALSQYRLGHSEIAKEGFHNLMNLYPGSPFVSKARSTLKLIK